jgi:phage replication O-like protein O
MLELGISREMILQLLSYPLDDLETQLDWLKYRKARNSTMPTLKLSKVAGETPWTKTPNVVIDQLMPTLRDTEFRVLVVIVRSTLGWNRDEHAVRLTYRMLQARTGRSSEAVAAALHSLERQGLIHVIGGRRSKTSAKRSNGTSKSEADIYRKERRKQLSVARLSTDEVQTAEPSQNARA